MHACTHTSRADMDVRGRARGPTDREHSHRTVVESGLTHGALHIYTPAETIATVSYLSFFPSFSFFITYARQRLGLSSRVSGSKTSRDRNEKFCDC